MNKILNLLRGDMRQIGRDPMLVFYFLGPLLLLVVVRYGIPLINRMLIVRFQYDLTVYYGLMMSIALVLIPLILGVLSGYLMLDERDENLISYYAVTPLTKLGYLIYRLILTVLLTIVYGVGLLIFADLTKIHVVQIVQLLLVMVLEAPIFALLLAAYASNKVEGLAITKGASLLIFAPAIAYLVPMPWQLLGSVMPTYWIAIVLLTSSEGELLLSTLYMGIGVFVQVIILGYLVKRFVRKLD